jgi:transketolase
VKYFYQLEVIKMGSCRTWYGKELLAMAKKDSSIIALDADLSRSTMSTYVGEELPQQFLEIGIAEQNMLGIAAGLALNGMKPFVNTFAVFLTGRAYDQIRQVIAYPALNVKLVGSSAGLSDCGDGATHQTFEDISLMRTLPHMAVIVPADHIQTKAVTSFLAAHNGPAYLRISRADTEQIFANDYQFRIGKVDRLLPGSDLAIIATGTLTKTALKAARQLDSQGISAAVINVSTIKPLDQTDLLEAIGGNRRVITFEEHSTYGGLGSTVAEVLVQEGGYRLNMMGIPDMFGQSAENHEQLLEIYRLTEKDLIAVAQTTMRR